MNPNGASLSWPAAARAVWPALQHVPLSQIVDAALADPLSGDWEGQRALEHGQRRLARLALSGLPDAAAWAERLTDGRSGAEMRWAALAQMPTAVQTAWARDPDAPHWGPVMAREWTQRLLLWVAQVVPTIDEELMRALMLQMGSRSLGLHALSQRADQPPRVSVEAASVLEAHLDLVTPLQGRPPRSRSRHATDDAVVDGDLAQGLLELYPLVVDRPLVARIRSGDVPIGPHVRQLLLEWPQTPADLLMRCLEAASSLAPTDARRAALAGVLEHPNRHQLVPAKVLQACVDAHAPLELLTWALDSRLSADDLQGVDAALDALGLANRVPPRGSAQPSGITAVVLQQRVRELVAGASDAALAKQQLAWLAVANPDHAMLLRILAEDTALAPAMRAGLLLSPDHGVREATIRLIGRDAVPAPPGASPALGSRR